MRRGIAMLGVLVACADASPAAPAAADGSGSGALTDGRDVSTSAAEAGPPPESSSTAGPSARPEGSSGEVASTTTMAELSGPYPIVLAHGFFGFDDFAGVGFVDYFWDLRAHLEAEGEREVFTPEVDPFNDSTTRGGQLLVHVEQILLDTGASRVNLIGHSQGGLDARVVANLRPDLVASVTTIATPHRGTPLADTVLDALPGGGAGDVADALVQLLGAPLWNAIGADTSIVESLRQFSAAGIAEFNAAYPDVEGVRYFSVAGRSDWNRGGAVCDVAAPDFVAAYADEVDPIDPLFALAEAIVDGGLLEEVPNDGLVRVEDAVWGEFWGCIPADHVDEIGHLFGDNPGLTNPFDHLAFYTDLVAHLRGEGV